MAFTKEELDGCTAKVREVIRDGEYAPGAELPGVHELARRCGVTIKIMMRVLSDMQGAGDVEVKPHNGGALTFVIPVTPSDAVERFLTVAEIAIPLRVSEMTVYRLIHSETLASRKFGRQFRVPESAVKAYVEAN